MAHVNFAASAATRSTRSAVLLGLTLYLCLLVGTTSYDLQPQHGMLRVLLQQSSKCTPPMAAADATLKPFCFQPGTISPKARAFLANTAASSTPFGNASAKASNPAQLKALVTQLREYIADASEPEDWQQYFKGTQNKNIGGVPAVFAYPKGINRKDPADTNLLIYLHGGGYVSGSCKYQLGTVASTAATAGLTVVCPEYRLAPEHPFPAGLNDALTVYKTLVKQQGYKPNNIVILGDSAGGGMVAALAVLIQRKGLPLPAALGMFSPWAELGFQTDTSQTLLGVDPSIGSGTVQVCAHAYVGGNLSLFSEPLVSPARANYASIFKNGSLPPTLIQVGLRELLLSEAVLLYHKMKAAAPTPGRVVISPYEGMWHVWQDYSDMPEAQAASKEMADFFARALNDTT